MPGPSGEKPQRPPLEPLIRVEMWEETSHVRSLGETWEPRRSRRRWSNERYRMLLLLRNNLAPDQTLVDVGCGPGFYVPCYLERVGPERTHLVDQSAAMLAHCRERYPALLPDRLHRGSIHDIPLPDGRFDVVVNCDVLMHIANYRRALAELFRICNPDGGRVFLRVNLTDGPTYGDLPSPERPDPGYVYWIAYGREEFRRSLAELGPATVTVFDRICRKPLKRGEDPFMADAAIVILTRGAPRRPLWTGSKIRHLLSRLLGRDA